MSREDIKPGMAFRSALVKEDIFLFAFHRLTGNRRGFYSVWVSRNHRIIFRFEDGNAFDVDLIDYH